MRNLRFYETDAAFKAYEQGAGGDGNSTKTSIPGVSGAWNLGKTYFNPHDEAKLTHTVTVKYVSMFDGTELTDSETIEIKYLSGVTQEIVLNPKTLDGYVAINDKVIVHIPGDVEVKIFYKNIKNNENPLIFNIVSTGTVYWRAISTAYTKSIEYKKNDGNWVSITSSTAGTSISVNAGDIVQFKGDNATYSSGNSRYNTFSGSTAKFEIEGNIMSLIDSENFVTATTLVSSYTFNGLFYNCTGLTFAENLLLPATTLADFCYYNMFGGCTSLTTAPELPATTLAYYCYNGMFNNCTSLTTAPELPATTLADWCYESMFFGCTSLTTAPELPATTLANYCYQSMFGNCTSLTTAPELPATTLTESCYSGMFEGCTSLTTAPVLPATTLASRCYNRMFFSCSGLNYIKCLATNISASYCTNYWTRNVKSTGTFVKNANMSSWTTGNSGIPANWTVQDA